jgi:UDPglucose 6-dehydrogenase
MVSKYAHTKNIAVIGLWHLGSVYATSLAEMGHKVTAFDYAKKSIKGFKEGVPPLYEPGLSERLIRYKKSLTFTFSEVDLKNKDYIFITHDLVVNDQDVAETDILETLFTTVARTVDEDTIVVISSQVPLGSSRVLVDKLFAQGFKNPSVIYFPENLRLGTAYDSFLKPERIIIGSDNKEALAQFEKDFNFNCPVVTMGLESAEMVKHALNTYLATCVSLSSEWSDIAERVGANMADVVLALKSDKRVSVFAPINPGLGFAGGTLGRDIQSLKKVAARYNYKPKLLESVYQVNQERIPFLLKKIKKVHPKLRGKTIGILGLTYKAGTSTLRRSMSLSLASHLHSAGVTVKAFDPTVTSKIKEASEIITEKNIKKFFKDLDMVVLMTDWKEFLEISPVEVGHLMHQKVVVDTKNFLNAKKWEEGGFMYLGMGI